VRCFIFTHSKAFCISLTNILQNEEGSDGDDDEDIHDFSPDGINWLESVFPLDSTVRKSLGGLREFIIDYLPSLSTSRKICNIYFRHAAWM
jgi:hypothetical protein